jgi:hypothetical protein
MKISSGLLSYILTSIKQCNDRNQIKRGLELITKLSTCIENVELFVLAPENFLRYIFIHTYICIYMYIYIYIYIYLCIYINIYI